MRLDLSSINFKGDTFVTAHLYEIELARLMVLSEDGTRSTLTVDDISKCFIGMKLVFPVISENKWELTYRTITNISYILNQITLNTSVAVKQYQYTCETLFTDSILPYITYNEIDESYYEYLQMRLTSFGSLNGKMLFTDHDLPIIVEGEREIFNHPDITDLHVSSGNLLYMPFPIAYKEVAVETKGKMNSVEITVGNVDGWHSQIILNHSGLKGREIVIKTVFLNDAVRSSLIKNHDSGTVITLPSRFNYDGLTPDLNDGFTECLYANKNNVTREFLGETDNIGFDNKTASMNATVKIDNTEHTQIPSRIYSRVHCPFIYKSWRCRFRSKMRLNVAISGTPSSITIQAIDKYYYFQDLKLGETIVVQIDDEQILLETFAYPQATKDAGNDLTNDRIRQLRDSLIDSEKTLYTSLDGIFYMNIKQRGYNSTAVVDHAKDAIIDIVTCKKTEHDCDLHAHGAFFGGFPAIPKNTNYSS